MERAIVLGGIYVIDFFIVIDEKIHVARHLSAFLVEAEKRFFRVIRRQSAVEADFGNGCGFFVRKRLLQVIRHIRRPGSGIGAEAAKVLIWACDLVGNRDAAAGGTVALAFKFEVEPHHELAGLSVEDDFRAFENAAFDDVTFRII